MAIHFLSGKPRAGKTLYGFKLLVDELVYGTRTVITNLPIKLPELNEYLQKKHPEKSIDLLTRVVQLSDDETGIFWTVRPGSKIQVLREDDWRAGKKPDYSTVVDNGVFYVIDEVHNFFNARKWMETGRDVLFYLSQHGKLGDTVICITQHVGNVDKQFRSVTQDYTYLRNYGKEKRGMFRLPCVFTRKTYAQPATDTSVAMETGTFRLDVTGLAACYNTAQGVGIHGRSADKSEKKSGFSWLWVVIMVPLAIYALYRYGPTVIARAITPKPPPSVVTAQDRVKAEGMLTTKTTQPVYATNPYPPEQALVGTSAHVAKVVTNVLEVTGVVTMGREVYVTLSDGRTVTSAKGDILSMTWQHGLILRDGTVAKIPVGRF